MDFSVSAASDGIGSRSRRTARARPVESVCTETNIAVATVASVNGSFAGSAAGTAAASPKGFSGGSFAIDTTGGSVMRNAVDGVGVLARGVAVGSGGATDGSAEGAAEPGVGEGVLCLPVGEARGDLATADPAGFPI